jgi:predicted HicB family RNase H-like nuclease
MKIYYKDKALLSFRVPHSWKKVLVVEAKKEKTTVNEIVSKAIEKKFGYAKIDDEDTKQDN